MKKPKVRIKEIKKKVKISEIKAEKPVQLHEHIEQPKPVEGIEAKTKTEIIPTLKGETRVTTVSAPGKQRAAEKDEERIFVSYDRFRMSDAEKRRVYSLDLRQGAPIRPRQTSTLERPEQSLFQQQSANPNEIHLERSDEGRTVNVLSESLAAQRAQHEYMEGSAVDYKPSRKRDEDFY